MTYQPTPICLACAHLERAPIGAALELYRLALHCTCGRWTREPLALAELAAYAAAELEPNGAPV